MNSNYTFSNTWCAYSELVNNLPNHVPTTSKVDILEVGIYEGASTAWFTHTYLNHNHESTLTSIDPFLSSDTISHVSSHTERVFESNELLFPHKERRKIYRVKSEHFWSMPIHDKYDIIYMDGSHDSYDTYVDVLQCYLRLNDEGVLWIDDYLGGEVKHCGCKDDRLKQNIDKALRDLKANQHGYDIIHKGYQLAIRKSNIVRTPDSYVQSISSTVD